MYIRRGIVSHLRELERYFPVLSITGPRQAEKTTLLKHLYPDYQYLSLEDPDLRQRVHRVAQLIKEQPVQHQLIYGGEESDFYLQEIKVKSWRAL